MTYRDNRSYIEKADLALADLTAGGGYLQPEQAKKFLRLVTKKSALLSMVTAPPMRAPKQQVPKIKFGSRILRAGQEATALAPVDRVRPDLAMMELDAKLFKGEVELSDEVLEDNIERGEFRQTLVELIADGVSRDVEEIVIAGNTLSTDPVLRVLDGLLAQATSNVVDAAGAPLSKDLLTDLLKSVPSEYLRDRKAMALFTSVDADLNYRNTLADRATAAGDRFLEQDAPILASGVPLRPIPLFPENLGVATDQTAVLLCHPKNIHVGFWRNVRIESERNISTGVLKIVVTIRFDVKFSDENGVGVLRNVGL